MIHPFQLGAMRYPVRMRWFLGVVWLLILAKCTQIWWAMVHWSVPFHPAWIVVPTLLFAALATGLWLGAHDGVSPPAGCPSVEPLGSSI